MHHSWGNPRCSPKNFYCLYDVATKSIIIFSKLPVCQKPFSTDINLSPMHPNMIPESYNSLPFLDDESEMQVLTLFQKQTGQTC